MWQQQLTSPGSPGSSPICFPNNKWRSRARVAVPDCLVASPRLLVSGYPAWLAPISNESAAICTDDAPTNQPIHPSIILTNFGAIFFLYRIQAALSHVQLAADGAHAQAAGLRRSGTESRHGGDAGRERFVLCHRCRCRSAGAAPAAAPPKPLSINAAAREHAGGHAQDKDNAALQHRQEAQAQLLH